MNPNQNFITAYQNLNSEQRIAVDTTEGPVMVYAGPGTGKTKVLTLRIANILMQTDTDFSNILCLTFTNAGVQSIRDNLRTVIGEEASKIAIHTFHSFANWIIQRKNEKALESHTLITQAERFQLLESLLEDNRSFLKSKQDRPVSKNVLGSLAGLFKDFKKDSIDKAKFNNAIDEIIAEIKADGNSYRKDGALYADSVKEIENLTGLRPVGDLYESYQQALKQGNKLEYEDMLDMAISILEQKTEELQEIKERFQYILVDEFQDTNDKQMNLTHLLIRGEEHPNIFIVGDDDQCIYKFQGANEENISFITHHLPSIKKITLRSNYRSTQTILNTAHNFISVNPNRPTEKANPLFSQTSHHLDELQVHQFEESNEEGFFIAEKINSVLKQQSVAAKDVTVLVRRRSHLDDVIPWLRYFKIAFSWDAETGNVLETQWGKKINSLLQYLFYKEADKEKAEQCLVSLLMARFSVEVVMESFEGYKKVRGTMEFSRYLEKEASYSEIASWIDTCHSFSIDAQVDVQTIQQLEQLLELQEKRVLEQDSAVIAGWDAFLNAFTQQRPRGSWKDLIQLLRYYEQNELRIECEPVPTENTIILSTIHGSKGLEYPFIFLVGCGEKQWEGARDPVESVHLPSALKKKLRFQSDDEADLRRLMYVGLTRAKHSLYISFCAKDSEKSWKQRNPSVLVKGTKNLYNGRIEHSTNKFLLHRNNCNSIAKDSYWGKRISEALKSFELTATSLDAYISNPYKFYEQSLLKFPGKDGEALNFGTAIHNTIEQLYKVGAPLTVTDDFIETVWQEQFIAVQYRFHPSRFLQYKKYGLETLITYAKEHVKKSAEEKYIIENMLHGSIGRAKIKGKIDLIVERKNGVKVIDFKTGANSKNLTAFKDEENIGEAHWRQAAIYRELVEQNFPDKPLLAVEFHYIETGEVKALKMDYNKSDWNQYLLRCWDQIKSLQIPLYYKESFFDKGMFTSTIGAKI